ncbi:MAG: MBL fold metallo-hydrolase [Treponema sp.]|jgi:glyoxylase-like metal-dependent hydrolase (beta-lactamase superfamily II)|nr:MBL fold metallo-hydrolase [Treponema sp.]
MKPIKTSVVLPNIFAVSTKFVNFFLVKINAQYIAFDTGTSQEIALQELIRLNIKPEDIVDVFLTHSDSDHIGGIGLFRNAKIFIPKQEEQMFNGSTKRTAFTKNRFNYSYKTLNDGETVDIDGASIKCIVTPGHTKGSACYILNGKYLFSGDNFSLKDGKAQTFTALFNMDGKEQKKSIINIISRLQNIEAVFTGHHGYTEKFTEAFEHWQK